MKQQVDKLLFVCQGCHVYESTVLPIYQNCYNRCIACLDRICYNTGDYNDVIHDIENYTFYKELMLECMAYITPCNTLLI